MSQNTTAIEHGPKPTPSNAIEIAADTLRFTRETLTQAWTLIRRERGWAFYLSVVFVFFMSINLLPDTLDFAFLNTDIRMTGRSFRGYLYVLSLTIIILVSINWRYLFTRNHKTIFAGKKIRLFSIILGLFVFSLIFLIYGSANLAEMGGSYADMSVDPFSMDHPLHYRRVGMPALNYIFGADHQSLFTINIICCLLITIIISYHTQDLEIYKIFGILFMSMISLNIANPGFPDIFVAFIALSISIFSYNRALIMILFPYALACHEAFAAFSGIIIIYCSLNAQVAARLIVIIVLYLVAMTSSAALNDLNPVVAQTHFGDLNAWDVLFSNPDQFFLAFSLGLGGGWLCLVSLVNYDLINRRPCSVALMFTCISIAIGYSFIAIDYARLASWVTLIFLILAPKRHNEPLFKAGLIMALFCTAFWTDGYNGPISLIR